MTGSLPDQSLITTTSAPDGATALGLPPTSYSFAYTVTTPTTVWNANVFPTIAAVTPACSDSICPGLDKQTCVDATGVVYGVLCDTRFSGIEITNSGKAKEMMMMMVKGRAAGEVEARSYTGSFEECVEFCDQFDALSCPGVAYLQGSCNMFDTITGTFAQAGGIAALRQS